MIKIIKNMHTPDPRYLPQAKNKAKSKKVKRTVAKPSFPINTTRPTAKPVKKSAPFGDNHVWAN